MVDISSFSLDPKVAQEAVKKVQHLSYNDLKKEVIRAMQQAGYPDAEFPPGMDTSREGLLDCIAGIAALNNAKQTRL